MMDAGLSAILAAFVAGAIALASSYVHQRHARKLIAEQLSRDIIRARIEVLLPSRKEAIERVWSTLVLARQHSVVDAVRVDRCLELTIWLPDALRPTVNATRWPLR